jgi:hypothetical protein
MSEQDRGVAIQMTPRVAVPAPEDRTRAVAGYGSAPTGELGQGFSRAAEPPRGAPRRQPTKMASPEVRIAIRTAWAQSRKAAQELKEAIEKDEQSGRFVAAENLREALAKLWNHRAARDINWQAILNHAQGMLLQLFQGKKIEELTPAQGEAIVEIIEHYLGTASKSADDLCEVVRLIDDAGCDPYAAISGDPQEAEG